MDFISPVRKPTDHRIRRAAEFGADRVEAAPRTPLWFALAHEFTHFFDLILWLAAGLAFFSAYAESGAVALHCNPGCAAKGVSFNIRLQRR